MPIRELTKDPARAAGAAMRCTAMLRNAIVAGQFPAGLRLPPERELAARFGVTRVTLRSALARIEAEHLVTVRHGSGYVVRDYRRHAGPDLIATLAELAATSADRIEIMRDLLAVRRHLARATLERILETLATRPDPEALERIEFAIQRFEASVRAKAPIAVIAHCDLEIVAELVAASRSAVLQLCFNPVAEILRESPALQAAMYRDPLSNVAAFRSVLALVKEGRRDLVDALVAELTRRDAATIQHLAGTGTPAKTPAKKTKRKKS